MTMELWLSKVHQTDFTPEKGNALQACVASIFNLHLTDVPNFIADRDGYWQAMLKHASRLGLGLIKVPLRNGALPFVTSPGTHCILRGTSPRGSHGHVIVAKVGFDGLSLAPVHDPHPDGTFLEGAPEWCAIYTCPYPATAHLGTK